MLSELAEAFLYIPIGRKTGNTIYGRILRYSGGVLWHRMSEVWKLIMTI